MWSSAIYPIYTVSHHVPTKHSDCKTRPSIYPIIPLNMSTLEALNLPLNLPLNMFTATSFWRPVAVSSRLFVGSTLGLLRSIQNWPAATCHHRRPWCVSPEFFWLVAAGTVSGVRAMVRYGKYSKWGYCSSLLQNGYKMVFKKSLLETQPTVNQLL